MTSEEKDTKPVPPYLAYKTLKNFLRSLSQGLPSRIDKTVMPSLSGGAQSQILHALKYLNLIEHSGAPTPALEPLVKAQGEEFQAQFALAMRASYPFLRDSAFNLQTTTAGQLDEQFGKLASGDTIRKCVTFFLSAAIDNGIPLSPYLKAPKRRSSPNGKARKSRPASSAIDNSHAKDQPPPPPSLSWQQMLLEKFPEFDPNWTTEVQAKWFEAFNKLMQDKISP